MTYEEATRYILNIPKFTKKNKPEHISRFLEYLGNPQKERKILHVAGTNGKGSVCVYLSTMLLAQKKTVGLFVSPHLIKMNERIVINGKQVSDETFLQLFEYVLDITEKMQEAGLPHPTFFEFLFGMAMTAFARTGVEYIVLETGLGGRLDATNSIEKPLATAITSIGLDHTEILGDTVEKIAFEKAGIIKPGVPVFYSDTCEKSNRVIENEADMRGAPCKKIGKDAYEILGIRDKHIAFSCANAYYGNTAWTLNNIGTYQPGNAMLAMEIMRFIFGSDGKTDAWREVLSQVKWAGRMEEILPGVYVDGAHNVSAVENFVRSVQMQKKENIVLFSVVRDKNYEEMIACLCKELKTDFYVLTRIENERGASMDELQNIFNRHTDKPVIIKESAREALQYVLKRQRDREIYCLGSLYLAGELELIISETTMLLSSKGPH